MHMFLLKEGIKVYSRVQLLKAAWPPLGYLDKWHGPKASFFLRKKIYVCSNVFFVAGCFHLRHKTGAVCMGGQADDTRGAKECHDLCPRKRALRILSVCLKIHDAHLVPHLGLEHIYWSAHRLYFFIDNQSLRTIVQLFWIKLQNIKTFVTTCITHLFSNQIFAALHQQKCGLYIGKR